jgi:glycosyltransferase involved in cell wall biosynthesis
VDNKIPLKVPLTVTIVTLNEEKNISRCIGSVPFASEIIVIDSFSQDKTCEIARSLGAKIHQEKWRGYGGQKAFAAEKAAHDWVLNLDADEAVSPELADKIRADFNNLDPETGYLIPRRSYYLGRWIDYGGWYPDYQKRLFHRRHSHWDGAPIHEKVISPKEQKWKDDLYHYVFDNISEQVSTNNRYSTLQAEKHHREGKKFSILKLIVKPWTKFIETYFFKRGFMDGLPGFIISVGAAYSVFIRWAKLWELQKDKQ